LFGIEPLQGQVVRSDIRPDTTTFRTEDIDRPVLCSDQWFRPVDIKVGPDGAIYFCDMYEQRIDHASHYAGRVTPETGRIYRLRAAGPQSGQRFDYGELTSEQLVELLGHSNRWHRQEALRLIGDRRDRSVLPRLERAVRENTGQLALEALWALNLTGGLNDELTVELLDHADPFVRIWTVRLAGDDHRVSDAVARKLIERATTEPSAEVRSQLACTARRLPGVVCMPMVRGLLTHSEDGDDLHIPLLVWWAIEAKAESDRELVLELLRDPETWSRPLVEQHLLDKLMRRYALAGSRQDLVSCAELLTLAPSPRHQQTMIEAFEAAYAGRSVANLPEELIDAIGQVGGGSMALQVRQGRSEAIRAALTTIADSAAPQDERLAFIRIFGEITVPEASGVLLDVVRSDSAGDDLREAALLSLGAYGDAAIAGHLVEALPRLGDTLRPTAETVLAGRRDWALALLGAVDDGRIAPEAISDSVRHKLLLHNQAQITELVEKHFGEVSGATTAEMQRRIDELQTMLSAADGAGNPYLGKVLYQQTCGKCHTLFDEGGKVGPDLTTFKRDDLRGILLNVVNPSAEIREGYENYTVVTDEGRIVTGFV
ncbi:MAG: dehydrogenase, partial [Planctomycetales bacterium]|nr:dehydrogenase [Planctomycetales bacterium]